MNESYPLEFSSAEVERLDTQSHYLFTETFRNLVQSEAEVLDLGCGIGSLAMTLEDKGVPFRNYFGIDFDQRSIEFAKKRFARKDGMDFYRFDLSEDGWSNHLKGKQFDLVIIRLMLWSFPEGKLDQLLSLVRKHMKTGAKIYLFEPVDEFIHVNSECSQDHQLLSIWKDVMKLRGYKTDFGRELYGILKKNGFGVQYFGMHSITSYRENVLVSKVHMKNIKKLLNLVREEDFRKLQGVEMSYSAYTNALDRFDLDMREFSLTECFYHCVGSSS